MTTNRIAGLLADPQERAVQPQDYRPAHQESSGWPGVGWPLIGLGVAALIVLGSIYVLPDVVRYMKMRSM